MGDKIIERIGPPIFGLLGGALVLGIIDLVVYLLKTIICAILVTVLMVLESVLYLVISLVIIAFGGDMPDAEKYWIDVTAITPQDLWWGITVILLIIYGFIAFASIFFLIFGMPEESNQEEQEEKELPPKVLKMLKGLISCGAVLIIACWIVTAVFIYNMVGGCD